MTKKTILSLALAGIITASSFVGCSAKPEAPAPTPENPTTPSVAADGREMEGNLYKTGYPIVKETESFSFFVASDGDPNNMQMYKDAEAAMNVKVEWQAYPSSVVTEKKNLMFNSGDLPDAIGGWLLGDSDIVKYGIQEKQFIPITNLIKDYAPHIDKAITEFPGATKDLTAPDGNIYSLPIMGEQPKTRQVISINKKWLDNLGLKMPTTTDEFYAVLKAFKDEDANGNGDKNDEIPLSTMKNNLGDLYGSFGRIDNIDHQTIENGKFVYTAIHPEYKAAVNFMNKLFSEKLLDQEVFTHDDSQYKAKGASEDSLYGAFISWAGYHTVGLPKFQAEYVPLPPLAGPDGAKNWNHGDPSVFRTQFVITSAAKNPATIMRWMDYFFEDEHLPENCYGTEGIFWDYNDKGEVYTHDAPDGRDYQSKYPEETMSSLPYLTGWKEQPTEMTKIKATFDQAYADAIVKERFPQIWMTEEQESEISALKVDIKKYAEDSMAKWIVGQGDINKEWDGYLKQLDKLGVQRYIELMQEVVDQSSK